jgi:hypothetical protein
MKTLTHLGRHENKRSPALRANIAFGLIASILLALATIFMLCLYVKYGQS